MPTAVSAPPTPFHDLVNPPLQAVFAAFLARRSGLAPASVATWLAAQDYESALYALVRDHDPILVTVAVLNNWSLDQALAVVAPADGPA